MAMAIYKDTAGTVCDVHYRLGGGLYLILLELWLLAGSQVTTSLLQELKLWLLGNFYYCHKYNQNIVFWSKQLFYFNGFNDRYQHIWPFWSFSSLYQKFSLLLGPMIFWYCLAVWHLGHNEASCISWLVYENIFKLVDIAEIRVRASVMTSL